MNKKKSPSKTFCILPWIHFSNRHDGHIQVCCKDTSVANDFINGKNYKFNLLNDSITSAFNSNYMKNIRLDMLEGRRPASCRKCFYEEKLGGRSKRIWENEDWSKIVSISDLIKDTLPDGEVRQKLLYVHLDLGRKCNLKCIMCGPTNSNLWDGDWEEIWKMTKNKNILNAHPRTLKDGSLWYENDHFWVELEERIDEIKRIYIIGGEPTITARYYKFLRFCIENGHAKNIEIRVNTNGMNITKDLISLWEEFKQVRVELSIDSFGKMNDYIRFGSLFSKMNDALKILDKTKNNIIITTAYTVSIYNIFYLPEFISWKLGSEYKKLNAWPYHAGLISFHFLYQPEFLNIKAMPIWLKEKVQKKLTDYFNTLKEDNASNDEFLNHPSGIKKLESIISYMNSADESDKFNDFLEYTKIMDDIRGTSFEETFSEFFGLIEEGIDVK